MREKAIRDQHYKKLVRLAAVLRAIMAGATDAIKVCEATGYKRMLVNMDLKDLESRVAIQRWKIGGNTELRYLKPTRHAARILAELDSMIATHKEPAWQPKPYINPIRRAFLNNGWGKAA